MKRTNWDSYQLVLKQTREAYAQAISDAMRAYGRQSSTYADLRAEYQEWERVEDERYWQVRDFMLSIYPDADLDVIEELVSVVLLTAGELVK